MGSVLIIEDDSFLQDFYRLFFKKIGGQVVVVEDGMKVLEEIVNGDVDLIIMDVNLRNTYLNGAKIDGIHFSKYIKMNYPQLHIPILLITAYPVSSMGNNMLEESMADDYLIKPITDYNQLVQKINQLVFAQNER